LRTLVGRCTAPACLLQHVCAPASEGNFSFMRTNAAYKRSMEIAYKRWRWVEKRLNK
jgi:hypothetical protein